MLLPGSYVRKSEALVRYVSLSFENNIVFRYFCAVWWHFDKKIKLLPFTKTSVVKQNYWNRISFSLTLSASNPEEPRGLELFKHICEDVRNRINLQEQYTVEP